MKHFASSKFWQCFYGLPESVQRQARHSYVLLKQNPHHPSLQFKPVRAGAFRSVRISLGYRALGIPVSQGIQWFWIGSHADYDKLLA
ncbi:MAG: hypothetical protein PHI11_11435 [Gallionella sp.]|nr:hypothetical protein [Gallionella sp.]